MRIINDLINANALFISLYALAVTFVMVIIIIKSRRKKKKYMIDKNEKINLFGLYQKEWERSEDVFTQQLFDNNERLEKEVKVLRKENSNITIFAALSFVFFIISLKTKGLFHKDKEISQNN